MTTFTLDMQRFVDKVKGNIEEFLVEFTQDVAEAVVRDTPVDTGFLRGSWWANIGSWAAGPGAPDKGGGTVIARMNLVILDFKPGDVIYLLNGANYAGFVHDGTSRMGARPWVLGVAQRAPFIAEATARRIANR